MKLENDKQYENTKKLIEKFKKSIDFLNDQNKEIERENNTFYLKIKENKEKIMLNDTGKNGYLLWLRRMEDEIAEYETNQWKKTILEGEK